MSRIHEALKKAAQERSAQLAAKVDGVKGVDNQLKVVKGS